MVKYIYYLALLFSVFVFSCNGESTEPETEKYSGITETGPGGSSTIGKIDDDDWRMVPIRGNVSEDLLSAYLTMAFRPAYPNPTNGKIVNLNFSISRASEITMYICDKPGNIIEYILKNEDVNAGNYIYSYTFSGSLQPGIYRIYLEIISPSAVYKSYGDIQYSR